MGSVADSRIDRQTVQVEIAGPDECPALSLFPETDCYATMKIRRSNLQKSDPPSHHSEGAYKRPPAKWRAFAILPGPGANRQISLLAKLGMESHNGRSVQD